VHAWAARLDGPGALDSALLFESGLDALCDATLCVQCPREVRRQRALQRSTASAKHFAALEAAQWPESEKLARADAAVSTAGSLELLAEELQAALHRLKNKT
ncbi:dephospho-CoA kinase, partial [Haliangium sp. UPWRP_2]|uniref:dephospho-CoA kinase n=1 Tax=Haliangium sp. UPWRP_2 TaxID=1931276 RepID=UPI0011B23C36